jgi:hypothetical protein
MTTAVAILRCSTEGEAYNSKWLMKLYYRNKLPEITKYIQKIMMSNTALYYFSKLMAIAKELSFY